MAIDVTRDGEDPRQWKLMQHGREKLTCRHCNKITHVPAPFHVLFAGPSLLALILFEKYGQHQPLNRQAVRECVGTCRAKLLDARRPISAPARPGVATPAVDHFQR